MGFIHNMKNQILYSYFFISFSLLNGGTTGKITGTITDKQSGIPLVGCNVLVEGTDLGASTDIDGQYFILNIPPGTHNVRAQMIGYATKKAQNVKVSIDLTTPLDFNMEIAALKGEEIVVIADQNVFRKDLTHSEARISSEELEIMPINEIWDVVSAQGTITKDEGGGIHIRGGRSQEVAYWVDGVSVTDGYDGGLSVAVDNNAIQELQVISGTFNAEYGQAMSGIINLVTKDGGKDYTGFFSTYSASYLSKSFFPFVPDTLTFSHKADNGKILDFNTHNIEASLSGPFPLLSDRLFFYGYLRQSSSNGWLNAWRIFDAYGNITFNPEDYKSLEEAPIETVSMDWRNKLNSNIKLTYKINSKMKLRLNHISSDESYQDYDHNAQHSPDGRLLHFNKGKNLRLNFTHSSSSRTFYTLDFSRYNKNYHNYAFKDPRDDRYIDPNFFFYQQVTLPPSSFKVWGIDKHRFRRETTTDVFKFDLTSQVSKIHQIKFGAEFRRHNLSLDSYEIQDADETDMLFTIRIPGEYEVHYNETTPEWETGAPGSWILKSPESGSFIGWDWQSTNRPAKTGFQSKEDALSFLEYFNKNVQFGRGSYQESPVEMSTYLQDKIEFKNVIINLGLRLDTFNSNGIIPANSAEPYIGNPRRDFLDSLSIYERENIDWKRVIDPNGDKDITDSPYANFLPDSGRSLLDKTGWWEKTKSITQISPRFSVAYPITDRGVIHFSFGHFFQTPSFEFLYTNPGYKMPEDIGKFGIYGNPALKPQKTVMYELGIRQEIFPGHTLEVTGYYRDVRNWLTTGIPIEVGDGISYFNYINRDYSNVRGLTLNIERRFRTYYGYQVNYTFQVAEGSNSNPDEEFGALKDNKEPTRMILPLNWDQTHTLNGTFFIGHKQWYLSLISQFGSGYPYTPSINKASTQGINTSLVNLTNSRRKPLTFHVDMNFIYKLNLLSVKTEFFIKVFNLFNRRNELTVYSDTGRANSTLTITSIEQYGRPNTVSEYYNHREWYSAPRQVQIGLKFGF